MKSLNIIVITNEMPSDNVKSVIVNAAKGPTVGVRGSGGLIVADTPGKAATALHASQELRNAATPAVFAGPRNP